MAYVRFWLNARLQPQAFVYDSHAMAYQDWREHVGAIGEYPELTAAQFNGRSDPPPAPISESVPERKFLLTPGSRARSGVDSGTAR